MNTIKYKDYAPLALAFGIILIALMVIYSDTLDGSKSFYGANDKVSAVNVKEAISKSIDYPYWFPWMMGGVPSVHSAQNISDYYPPNYIMIFLNSLGMPWFWNYIFHLLFAGMGMYLLCVRSKLDKFISVIPALGFSIMPYMTGMLVHGHGSQVMTLCYMPWIFYSYMKLRDNPSIGRLAIFALFLAFQLLRGHVQMAYYTWMMLGLFIMIDIIWSLIAGNKNKIKWILYTVSGLCLGVLGSFSLYIPMLSYTPFSTRSSGESGGAGIGYVTDYSFSLGEVLTFLIPSYYGFGDQTYWGTMPFTAFPHYMSVILLMFAIYGVIRYKWTRLKIFSLICFIFFLTLSFGKNLIGFYTFFYDCLPFFSKFRNPTYLLIVVQFCTMVFAGMGLSMVLKDIKESKIILPIYSSFVILLFCIISFSIDFSAHEKKAYYQDRDSLINQYKKEILIANPSLEDPSVYKQYKEHINAQIESIKSFYTKKIDLGKSLIQTDVSIMQIIILLTFSFVIVIYFIYPFSLKKYQFGSMYLSLGLVTFIGLLVFLDFYFVDRKITNPEKGSYLFSSKSHVLYKDFYKSVGIELENKSLIRDRKNYLGKSLSNVQKEILKKKKDKEIFRIIDFDGGSGSNSWSKYHIEDVRGYHPAKLKSHKDFFKSDEEISHYILNMLNVKYIVQDQRVRASTSEERAYFIKNLYLDHDNDKEKRFNLYMTSAQPSEISYITSRDLTFKLLSVFKGGLIEELNTSVHNFSIISGRDIITGIDNSNPNEVIINFKTSGPQFLAISEIYYPNGWYATINQESTDIYEVNDLIRGIFIDSAGEYELKMRFEPSDLKWGMWLSSIAFISIIGMSIWGIVRRYTVK